LGAALRPRSGIGAEDYSKFYQLKAGCAETREEAAWQNRIKNMVIGVISDTHGLLRPEALRVLRGSTHIIHAGDIGDPAVLDRLREIAPVTAVRGNVDRGSWAQELSETELVEIEEVSIYVLHVLKQLDLRPEAAGIQVLIYGHSHVPEREIRAGVLYFNPGSAGPKRFRLPVTVGRLIVRRAEIHAEIVPLLA
jgi:uncharacterized protein